MEDDLKCCNRKSCKRHRIGVFRPNSKYCTACGGKLRRFFDTDETSQDPIIDDGPDHKSVTPAKDKLAMSKREQMEFPKTAIAMPTRDQWRNTSDGQGKATWNSYGIMLKMFGLTTYADFKGTWSDYEAYLDICGVGQMIDPTEVSALIARTRAYAASRNLDWESYNSFNPTNQKGIVAVRAKSDTFTTECTDIKGCPVAPKVAVFLPQDMWQGFIHLCKEFNTEWLAYLKGERKITEAGAIEYHITGFYFPPQKCTPSHVDIPADFRTEEGTVGDIHSHVGMNAFFSAEDERHFNWPLHMVANNKGECAISVAHQLECGRTTRISGSVYVTASAEHKAIAAALTAKLTTDNRSGFRYSN